GAPGSRADHAYSPHAASREERYSAHYTALSGLAARNIRCYNLRNGRLNSKLTAKGKSGMTWKVVIEHGNLGVSAAHFVTFEQTAEALHGHNYGVRVEVTGDLTEAGYVVDFVALKTLTRALCDELNHRFLLPRESRHLRITEQPEGWEIRYKEQQYVIP